MAVRIGFKVIEASSEDDHFRASELNHQEPTSKGWRTKRNSPFPQHIIVELDGETYITKIQIFSHHYLIARHIDVYVGNKNRKEIDFVELGMVVLNSSMRNVRELKNIYVNTVGRFVKLVLHEPHADEQNLHNQVSLFAINILGELLSDKTISDDLKKNIERPSVHYSPLDDLSFLMFRDAEVVHIIKQLEEMKIENNDADLGCLISKLEKIGKMLVLMEVTKRQASEAKNLRMEESMKKKIENQRSKMHSMLNHLRLAPFPSKEEDHTTPVKIVGCQTKHSSSKAADRVPLERLNSFDAVSQNPSLEVAPPDHVLRPTRQFFEAPSLSIPPDRPEVAEVRVPNDETIELNEEDVQSPGRINVPAEELAEKEEKDANHIVDVFGMTTAREVFSKRWYHKLQGLQKILSFLETPCNKNIYYTPNSNSNNNNDTDRDFAMNVTKAVEQAVLRVLKEGIPMVFESCLAVYKVFLLNFATSHTTLKLDLFLEHTLPQLLPRLVTNKKRARNMVSMLVVELSKSADFKYKRILMEECFKILRQNPISLLTESSMLSSIYLENEGYCCDLAWDSFISYLDDSTKNNHTRKCAMDFLSQLNNKLEASENVHLRTKVKNLLKRFECIDKGSRKDLTSKSQNKFLNEAPKGLISHPVYQKSFAQNQTNKVAKDKKVFKVKHPPNPLATKNPQAAEGSSKISGALCGRIPLRDNKLQSVSKKTSPHRQSMPSIKLSKGKPTVKQHPVPPRQLATPTPGVVKMQRDEKKRRSFSLDRKKSENDVDRPVIDSGETQNDGDSCPFCGKEGVICTNVAQIPDHFLGECPMLMRCELCPQKLVLEVRTLSEHQLTKCHRSDLFQRCQKCKRAAPKASLEKHMASNVCKGVAEGMESCPLCGDVLEKKDSAWVEHLAGPKSCRKKRAS